jgi:TonB family protein
MIAMLLLVLAAPQDAAPPTDAEGQDTAMWPVTNPGRWATNDDYPARAMREEREGTTGFRLIVGADGVPSACEVTSSSGHGDLDGTTCRLLMERARFRPGRNARGEPAGGTYSNRIRWQIPTDIGSFAETAGWSFDIMRESWPRAPISRSAAKQMDVAAIYPATARAAREEGVVGMTLGVDAKGDVTGCDISKSSGFSVLDSAACDAMRRDVKFYPALDPEGKPTRGVVATQFHWVLPPAVGEDGMTLAPAGRKFPMSEPGGFSVTMMVGADGRVSDCDQVITGSFGAMPRSDSFCDGLAAEEPYIPFVGADGKPVARRVVMRSELLVEDVPPTKAPAAK